ncbi:helix-turn-helix domain-containing protein [Thalassovita sp.]|uniref:TetR/AcrR family transcriptional regulator n=1 Tax=Thalassovita sp. TaxID=1979401 RepID=UPI002881E5B4|nr:helix-turn-helix domain-containing protein [Thalassovita sp.]MDF1802771.1 helix-turn-helix domain containing protein [Thalassovita sp.]
MQELKQKMSGLEPKQQAILSSAFEAFRLYGFKRTSMEDIARGAGMSRAALYLHYRNKEDIFRSLAQGYYDAVLPQLSELFTQDLPAPQMLARAFEVQHGSVVEALLSSPHGPELLDTKYAQTADIVAAGDAKLAEVYAGWLERSAQAGTVSLAGFGGDAVALARTMLDALHGVKMAFPGIEEYRASIARLALLFGRALSD